MPSESSSLQLPAWPCLRPDAQVVAPPRGSLHVALSLRHLVSIENPPAGLAEWLVGLDGLVPLAEAIGNAPVPDEDAAHVLAELDRAGLLADASYGVPFRHVEDEQGDALGLASRARGVGHPPPAGRVWVAGQEPWRSRLASALDGCTGLAYSVAGPPADIVAVISGPFQQEPGGATDRADALGIPRLSVKVSAVDAVMSPLDADCASCRGREVADDWGTWLFGGRAAAAPRLPVHHRALVIATAVEHILTAVSTATGGSLTPRAGYERVVDLRRGTVTLRQGGSAGCACLAA